MNTEKRAMTTEKAVTALKKQNQEVSIEEASAVIDFLGNMKTAFLYIRVSTDEQANKGYSQRYQEEVLQKYCQLNQNLKFNNFNIIIIFTIPSMEF